MFVMTEKLATEIRSAFYGRKVASNKGFRIEKTYGGWSVLSAIDEDGLARKLADYVPKNVEREKDGFKTQVFPVEGSADFLEWCADLIDALLPDGYVVEATETAIRIHDGQNWKTCENGKIVSF